MYNTQLKLEEKKKKGLVLKQDAVRIKCTLSFLASRCLVFSFYVLPPTVPLLHLSRPSLRKRAKFSELEGMVLYTIHKEQPAMYFPVANLFLTSDMR